MSYGGRHTARSLEGGKVGFETFMRLLRKSNRRIL